MLLVLLFFLRNEADPRFILSHHRTAQRRRDKDGDEKLHYDHIKDRKFGDGLAVRESLPHLLLAFIPMYERLATIRIKTKFLKISDNVTNDAFLERLERAHERNTRHVVAWSSTPRWAKREGEGIFSATSLKFCYQIRLSVY